MNYIYRQRARQSLGSLFANPWLMGALALFLIGALNAAVSGVTSGLATLFIFGSLEYGKCYIFLKRLRSNQEIEISEAFTGFTNDFMRNMVTGLLVNLYIALWSLLFLIPGIIKYYSYSMAFYISLDHPEYSSSQCIDESRRLMDGHKWDLFCLDLSFIGWYILGILCAGVGIYWAEAYYQQAKAHFYHDLVASSFAGQVEVE